MKGGWLSVSTQGKERMEDLKIDRKGWSEGGSESVIIEGEE